MPSTTIKCRCGARAFIMVPRRNGTATAFQIQAYEMGWTLRGQDWFCSGVCRANAAKDITPVDKLLTNLKEGE